MDVVMCFFGLNKICIEGFDIISRLLKKFVENENLVCSAKAGRKTEVGILQLWFN